MEIAKTRQELVEFWNQRAEHYPRFHDEDGYESLMLSVAKEEGVEFKGKRVLDLGCGSGMYTIRLAREGAQVTGLDISDRMLAINQADAKAQGIDHIKYVNSDWLEYEPAEPFEVVFCSMCPAMKEDKAKVKLLGTPTEALVYIGFVEYFAPKPHEDLLEHYKLERKLFRSGPDMADWLEARGERYNRHPRRGYWTVRHSRQEGPEWCRTILGDHGEPNPDPEVIDKALAPFWSEVEQAYIITTPYWVEMIIWRPDPKR